MKYNEDEMNELEFEIAIQNDKRTFSKCLSY